METVGPETTSWTSTREAVGADLSSPRPVGSAQPQQDLEQHKGTIKRLFIDEKMSLNDVMGVMEKEYGVSAS